MNRTLLFSSLLLSLACFSFANDKEIAVADKDLPQLPQPPATSLSTFQDGLIIEHLNAIVLVSDPKEIKKEGLRYLDGIFVVDLKIPGGAAALRKRLEEHFLGKALTKKRLADLKQEILDYYREKKLPVVAVQVPEQEVTGGVLQLVLVQGKLGSVRAVGNRWTKSSRLEGYIRLKPGDEIDENVLISDLALMNRNPFRRTDLLYTPGVFPGTTDIELLTEDRKTWRIYAGAENNGVKPTGTERLLAGFNLGNVFGLDHVFSYQYTSSSDFYKFQAHTIHYTAPLPNRHILSLFGGVSFVHPHLGIHHSRSKGYGTQESIRYEMPVKPSQTFLHQILVGFDFKRTNNIVEYVEQTKRTRLFGNNVNLTQLMAGYNAAWETTFSKITFDGKLFYSPGKWLPDQSNKNYNSLRRYAKNDYLYLRADINNNIKIWHGYSLVGNLSGQLSDRNLLPSEEFGLGGADSVRGYEERVFNADNALLFNAELRSPVMHFYKNNKKQLKDELQLLLFLDYGLGASHQRTKHEPFSEYLIGAGPGFRYIITNFLSVKFDWGIKLHRKELFGKDRSRVHFSVIASF